MFGFDGQAESVAIICKVITVRVEVRAVVILADIRHFADIQRDVLRGEDGDLFALFELFFKELLGQIHSKNLRFILIVVYYPFDFAVFVRKTPGRCPDKQTVEILNAPPGRKHAL